MHLAVGNLFRARWTEQIHEEWISSLLRSRPDLTREKLERTRRAMNDAVLDCLVTGYEELIEGLTLPDPNDRHILAAAIRGRADTIVTMNLKHFPDSVLSSYGIEPQHPDTFVCHLLSLNLPAVCLAAKLH